MVKQNDLFKCQIKPAVSRKVRTILQIKYNPKNIIHKPLKITSAVFEVCSLKVQASYVEYPSLLGAPTDMCLLFHMSIAALQNYDWLLSSEQIQPKPRNAKTQVSVQLGLENLM